MCLCALRRLCVESVVVPAIESTATAVRLRRLLPVRHRISYQRGVGVAGALVAVRVLEDAVAEADQRQPVVAIGAALPSRSSSATNGRRRPALPARQRRRHRRRRSAAADRRSRPAESAPGAVGGGEEVLQRLELGASAGSAPGDRPARARRIRARWRSAPAFAAGCDARAQSAQHQAGAALAPAVAGADALEAELGERVEGRVVGAMVAEGVPAGAIGPRQCRAQRRSQPRRAVSSVKSMSGEIESRIWTCAKQAVRYRRTPVVRPTIGSRSRPEIDRHVVAHQGAQARRGSCRRG